MWKNQHEQSHFGTQQVLKKIHEETFEQKGNKSFISTSTSIINSFIFKVILAQYMQL